MARTTKSKRITVTLEVEPPYTAFAVLTFGGADGGLKVTSKPIGLKDKSVILVGENGGIFQMTRKEWSNRKGAVKEVKTDEESEDDE